MEGIGIFARVLKAHFNLNPSILVIIQYEYSWIIRVHDPCCSLDISGSDHLSLGPQPAATSLHCGPSHTIGKRVAWHTVSQVGAETLHQFACYMYIAEHD